MTESNPSKSAYTLTADDLVGCVEWQYSYEMIAYLRTVDDGLSLSERLWDQLLV